MDYTQSDSFDTHAGTGNRMHNQGKATPTAIGDRDLNQVIWSLMEVVKQAGLAGVQFDPATPGTYTRVRDAILTLMQRQTPSSSAAGGTADAITGTYTPAVAALTNGLTLFVRAASANATATPTFTPNNGTIATKAIVKGNGLALAAGDIAGAGHWLELQYDLTLDRWVLQNPATGVLGFASTAEAQGLSIGNKALTPATLFSAFQGSNQSRAASGYQKLPGGLILQWGTASFNGPGSAAGNLSSTLAAFPIAFPTGCLSVAGCGGDQNEGSECGLSVLTWNATNFTIGAFRLAGSNAGGETGNYRYMAIGY